VFQLLLCNYYNVFNMSKSCSGLLKDLVHCLRESECFQVRRLGAFFSDKMTHSRAITMTCLI
jgi:hypothetical protein